MASGQEAGRIVRPANASLSSMESDFLYHLGYTREQCVEKFGGVKFVVMGGSTGRMRNFAEIISKEIGETSEDISKTDRFAFFRIGPVLSVSHGMGVPSITILLHEILKLLHYAKVDDPIIMRMGTSGGLGVEPGTVVVTNKSFNACLKEAHEVVILGEVVSRETVMDQELAKEIHDCQDNGSGKVPTVLGGTMCTDDFYEGQARRDGVVCQHDEEEKMAYLRRVREAGVSNIEMECTAIASLCFTTEVKCAVVCVTLLDRLKGDQVNISDEVYKDYSMRPQTLIARFIKSRLGIKDN